MNSKLRLCTRVCLTTCLMAGLSLSLTATADTTETAGKTIMARGDVSATNDAGKRDLARRAPVFMVDKVNTGAVSATQLRMRDGGLLALQEQTELEISRYAFNAQTKQGSVQMNLLKGGLRTVTGALQTDKNNYLLKTPIASIGVRGTHYEAELANGDLYLAGWEGAIDITVDSNQRQFSLGPNENYRFAVVRSDGTVEFLVAIPAQFADGHSSAMNNVTASQLPVTFALFDDASSTVEGNQATQVVVDNTGEAFVDNDLLASRLLPDELVINRMGEATFNQLASSEFSSSSGPVSDINLAITVDFDNASIPSGNISFQDNTGEWFAAFNGLIDANALNVKVNFAAHNNNLADGTINGIFIDNASGILGNVNLFEIDTPSINAEGTFLLIERTP